MIRTLSGNNQLGGLRIFFVFIFPLLWEKDNTETPGSLLLLAGNGNLMKSNPREICLVSSHS